MRIALGLLSLVVVLAIVGVLAKRALHTAPTAPASATGALAGDAAARTPHDVTRKVADDVGKLMQQAPARVEGGER